MRDTRLHYIQHNCATSRDDIYIYLFDGLLIVPTSKEPRQPRDRVLARFKREP